LALTILTLKKDTRSNAVQKCSATQNTDSPVFSELSVFPLLPKSGAQEHFNFEKV